MASAPPQTITCRVLVLLLVSQFVNGTTFLVPAGDDTSLSVNLSQPFLFYGNKSNTLAISTNGVISFGSPFLEPPFSEDSIPPLEAQSGKMTPPLIAPLWSDIDTSESGNISFTDVNLVNLTSDIQSLITIIQTAFRDSSRFIPTQLYNISWQSVPPFLTNSSSLLLNTFFCELATDGNSSYAIFTYVDIQWTTANHKNSSHPIPPQWIGFTAGDGVKFRSINGSLSNISTTGNVLYPKGNIILEDIFASRKDSAIWAFRIDGTEISSGGCPSVNDIRLVDGTTLANGRVEVCINNTFAVLCQSPLNDTGASDLCTQLGFSRYGAKAINGNYFERYSTTQILNHDGDACAEEMPYPGLICQDISTSFANCTNGEMRLLNSSDDIQALTMEGTVEVCVNGAWGSVCPRGFGLPEAAVVCNQITGFTGEGAIISANGTGTGPILLDGLRCLGTESSLVDCRSLYPIGVVNCDLNSVVTIKCRDINECQSDDVCPEGNVCRNTFGNFTCECAQGYIRSEDGITCQSDACTNGSVQLRIGEGSGDTNYDILNVRSPSSELRAGRVEVCVGGQMGSVCSDNWDNKDASVVCTQLGYSPHGAIALTDFVEGELPGLLTEVECIGNETNLFDCRRTENLTQPLCDRFADAAVVCQINVSRVDCDDGQVRLTGGNKTRGRLEVCINNAWGTVCSNSFGQKEAAVACGRLGGYNKETASVILEEFAGASDLPIFLDMLDCDGSENDLLQCNSFQSPGIQDILICDDTDLVGISCEDIDECANITCDTNCTNTIGSYECFSCEEGFLEVQLTNGSYICEDINECNEFIMNNCSQVCENTIGDFMCTCHPGYEGSSNCTDIDECSTGNNTCVNAECVNTEGGFNCSCRDGYMKLLENNTDCFCEDGDIVLINGTSSNEGRVEICINNTYGTVCNDFWDFSDAQVVCSKLSYPPDQFGIVLNQSHFSAGSGAIFLDDVDCTGSETSLLDCVYNRKTNQCDHSKDAGVRCGSTDKCIVGEARVVRNELGNTEERLFYSFDGRLLSGRVEYCFDGSDYLAVCGDNWDSIDASFVCEQVGFSGYGAIAVTNGWLDSTDSRQFLLQVNCTGEEASFDECGMTMVSTEECRSSNGAAVCQAPGIVSDDNCTDGQVRLINGSTPLEGRPEICINRAWGTICSDGFSEDDALVACIGLGLPFNETVVYRTGSVFGKGSGPIFLDELACSGDESSLLNCPTFTDALGLHNCRHSQDVGIMCVDYNECLDDMGGCQQICNNLIPYFNCSCRTGYTLAQDNRSCIANCIDGHIMLDSAGLSLQGGGNSSLTFGRVEVCFSGTYGTVDDDSWSNTEAAVVCRQLGISPYGAVGIGDGVFSTLSLPTYLSGVTCQGTEDNLLNCSHNVLGTASRSSFSDSGVICFNKTIKGNCTEGEVKISTDSLVYSQSSTGQLFAQGRVEVCINDAWSTICKDSFFDSVDAGVICQQLGGFAREPVEVFLNSSGVGPVFLSRVECTNDDMQLLDCQLSSLLGIVDESCDHSNDVSVSCSDINECQIDNGNCTHICNNTIGGFECLCNYGFELQNDSITCIEINACLGTNNCSEYANCTDTGLGTFQCSCLDGFYGDGSTCENIDECENTTTCHENANCTDLFGSYVCSCRPGFEPSDSSMDLRNSELVCIDIDECYLGEHTCDIDNGFCNNTEGSYECPCYFGYNSTSDKNNTCYCSDGQVRLIIGEEPSVEQTDGRVEVCNNNTYGTVCHDRWDVFEAQVVCNQLHEGANYSLESVVPVRNAALSYGEGNGTILLDDLICSGNESNLLQCSVGGPSQHSCNSSEIAGVMCGVSCNEGSIRLLVGDNYDYYLDNAREDETEFIDDALSQGRVEICVNGTYGTVCADEDSWSNTEAAVVCKELGFTEYGATAVNGGFFSTDTRGTAVVDVQCQGTEDALRQCSYNTEHDGRCVHDAAVVCQDSSKVEPVDCTTSTIRVTNSTRGRVEICINNVWGTVCDYGFSFKEAMVVCGQLNMFREGAIALLEASVVGSRAGPVFLEFSGKKCFGDESSILECDHRPLSLITPICASMDTSAAVICPACSPTTNSPCGSNTQCIFHSELSYICQCLNGFNGDPLLGCDDINECDTDDGSCHNCTNTIGSYDCRCQKGFEPASQEGIKYCKEIDECNPNTEDGNACHQNASCTSKERRFQCVCNPGFIGNGTSCEDEDECLTGNHDCSPYADCSNSVGNYSCDCQYGYFGNGSFCACDYTMVPIRLINGTTPTLGQTEGNVEVCFNGVFGSVCDDFWNEFNARVVCQQLGHTGPNNAAIPGNVASAMYGNASSFHLDNVICTGNEVSLLDCPANPIGENDCDTSEVAGVKCGVACLEGSVRLLVEDSYSFYSKLAVDRHQYPDYFFIKDQLRLGRVEICIGGSYTTICKDANWNDKDASVVCSQLGFSPYGAAISTSNYNEGLLSYSLKSVTCIGNESNLIGCSSTMSHICPTSEDADVVCQSNSVVQYSNCSDGETRLIKDGETHLFEGRVEICVNNAWGTVCNKLFDYYDALVVCQSLGYPADESHVVRTDFGPGSGPIFLSSCDCDGTESSLLTCDYFSTSDIQDCDHRLDVGVYCEPKCLEFVEYNSFYGNYSWPGNTAAEAVISITCQHLCGALPYGNATRRCAGFQMWEPTDFSSCPTARTCQLHNILMVPLTTQSAGNTVMEVLDVLSGSGREDQTQLNLNAITSLFEELAALFPSIGAGGQEIIRNMVNIVSGVQNWPDETLQGNASRLDEQIQSIIQATVLDATFSGVLNIMTPAVSYVGEKVNTAELKSFGKTFDVGSYEATISLPSGLFTDVSSDKVSLSFTAYANGNLFALPSTETRNPRFSVGSPLVGAVITSEPGLNGRLLAKNITIVLFLHNTSYTSPTCNYWDVAATDWRPNGCSLVKYNSGTGEVECTCNHLTNFGIIANTNPITCEVNTHTPNTDFTECIALSPNVSVSVNNTLSQPNTTNGGDEGMFSVGFGHEFGLICETTEFFSVVWMFENDTQVMELSTTVPGGQLYSLRLSQSMVALRTFYMGESFVEGIQESARGVYKCVATNFDKKVEEMIEINPTGLMGPSTTRWYLRVSSELADLSPDHFAAYFGTKIIQNLSTQTEDRLVATAECNSIAMRVIDIENSWERFDCVISSRSDYEAVNMSLPYPAILEESIRWSNVGFCDPELMNEVSHGFYNWSETEVGTNITLDCFYEDIFANSTANVTRRCSAHREWEVYFGGKCITKLTFMFQQLSQTPITADNVEEVVALLGGLVSSATDTDDQNSGNLLIVAGVISSAANLVEAQNISTTIGLLSDITSTVSNINTWPMEALQASSVDVVSSFETIGENIVLQENFTNITIVEVDLLFQGIQINSRDLLIEGFVFDMSTPSLISVDNTSNSSNFTTIPSYLKTRIISTLSNITVNLVPEVFNSTKQNSTGLVFVIYPDSFLFPLDEVWTKANLLVSTPVVGATVANLKVSNLTMPVMVTLPIVVDIENYTDKNPTFCVSWNFTSENWTDSGCHVETIDLTKNVITCKCDHLTNFAILMDISAREEPSEDVVLDIISYIGVTMSLIGLVVTIITLLGSKKLRSKDITKFQVQFSLSLMFMLLIFAIGVDRKENEVVCTIMSCLLQYFVLTTVLWMTAQALIMFKKLVIVFGTITTKFVVSISLICWLLPLLSVVAALGTLGTGENLLIFKDEASESVSKCIVKDIRILFGTLLVPIYLLLIVNFVIFLFILRVIIRNAHRRRKMVIKTDENQAAQISLRTMLAIFSVSVVFGLAWILGVFTIKEAAPIFRYLFVICNSFQGFIFSLLIVIVGSDGREFWLDLLRIKQFPWKKVFSRSGGSFDQTVKSTDISTSVDKSGTQTLGRSNNELLEAQNELRESGDFLEMGFVNTNYKENSTDEVRDGTVTIGCSLSEP